MEMEVVRDEVVFIVDDCAHYTKCHRVYIYMQVDALPNKTICYMIYILLPSVAVQIFKIFLHVITLTEWHTTTTTSTENAVQLCSHAACLLF